MEKAEAELNRSRVARASPVRAPLTLTVVMLAVVTVAHPSVNASFLSRTVRLRRGLRWHGSAVPQRLYFRNAIREARGCVDLMLGENIVPDERGKVTGIRALPAEVQGPRTELTFQTKGKILGIEFSNLGTIQSSPKPGGVLYGQ